MKISGILLAAGLSRRMNGKDKLLLLYNGETLLQRAVNLLNALPLHEKIIVTTSARLESVTLSPLIKAVINPNPEEGQSVSLRLGIKASAGDGFIFLNADQPKLTPGDIIPLLESAVNNAGKIIYAAVNGSPRPPTVFPPEYKPGLLALSGGIGGREIRNANPEACIAIEARNPCNFKDIDSEDDYRNIN